MILAARTPTLACQLRFDAMPQLSQHCLQEDHYTIIISHRTVGLFDQQLAAQRFMNMLESLCNLYKAVTQQDTTQLPMSLRRSAPGVNKGQHQSGATVEQERCISKLLCALSLLESGVRPKDTKCKPSQGKAAKQAKDIVNNAHMMPALVFLQTCSQETKQVICCCC